MDEPKTNQERKATTFKMTAGGGIGGIVFLGGALVAGTVVSALAFKNRRTSSRTEQHPPKSAADNDVTPPSDAEENLSSDLEMMMKSSKDHHNNSQIIKGLTFLLPSDSPLPFLPHNSSIDAAAEKGMNQIESDQALRMDDKKSKLEVNGAGNQEMLSEIHEESTTLFDESGIIITKEECSIPASEASSFELGSNKNIENSVVSDEQTVFSDGLIPESDEFHSYGVKKILSVPLVDSPLHSESESTNEDENSPEGVELLIEEDCESESTNEDENSSEGVELLIEEDCESESFLPLLDSALLSESENTNEEMLSKENSPVSDEAVELLEEEEEDSEGKSLLPLLLDSSLVFESESMNKKEFSTEPIPFFSESVGLQVEDCEVKSSLPLLDSAKPETPLVSDKALELTGEDFEANNVGTGSRDHVEVKKELDICDAIVQEMILEDLVHEIAQEDQVRDDKETLENHDEEILDSELVQEDQVNDKKVTLENLDEEIFDSELVEAIEVKKEGETFDVVCDSIEVGEDKLEVPLIGEEVDEENRNEIVGVDRIIAEVIEEVKSIGERDIEANIDKCERNRVEALLDQVDEEEEEGEERVEVSEDEERVSNPAQDMLKSDELGIRSLTEESLYLSDVAIEVVCLDPIKVGEETEMRLTAEETDVEATKSEAEPMESADDVLENLEDDEKEEESDGDIVEDESIEETADVDEFVKSLENGKKDDDGSCSLIIEQDFSETMVDSGFISDSEKVSPFIEAANVDETACVDQVIVEDEYLLPIQSNEKNQLVESSDEEDDDDGEEEEESEDEDEESSEGTEDLSNYNAVWPAESIQQGSLKLEQMKTHNQATEMEGERGSDNDDEVEAIVREVENQSPTEPWKVKSWTLATLAMIWCLCHWYLDLPYDKVSIVALVISIALLIGFPKRVLTKHK